MCCICEKSSDLLPAWCPAAESEFRRHQTVLTFASLLYCLLLFFSLFNCFKHQTLVCPPLSQIKPPRLDDFEGGITVSYDYIYTYIYTMIAKLTQRCTCMSAFTLPHRTSGMRPLPGWIDMLRYYNEMIETLAKSWLGQCFMQDELEGLCLFSITFL